MPLGRECLFKSTILFCQLSEQIGNVPRHQDRMLTIHTYERNPNHRHCHIRCVKPIPLASAVGSEQKYSRSICPDLIFTVEIDYFFDSPENDVAIANESFTTIVGLEEFNVTFRERKSHAR